MTILLHAEGLTKDYHQSVRGTWADTGGGAPEPATPRPAVADIDLDLESGSALAVIGPNGAGKSTLLRLVAGITAPSSGMVSRTPRCASLIELGAGFHNDLSAVENVELGLTLAGVTGRHRRQKRSRVIEFAELAEFVDQPVRHLSNGQLARLSCSLAINTDPELLLVDEVLAVGDASFQRRMLEEVDALVASGGAVVLVTHSLELASRVCAEALWISEGRQIEMGCANEVVARYEAEVRGWGRDLADTRVILEGATSQPSHIRPGEPCELDIDLTCLETLDCLLRIEFRPSIGPEAWMRRPDESGEERELNLVAATDAIPVGTLPAGSSSVRVSLPVVPVTDSTLELAVLVSDRSGRVHDEWIGELRIGSGSGRPHFHMDVGPLANG